MDSRKDHRLSASAQPSVFTTAVTTLSELDQHYVQRPWPWLLLIVVAYVAVAVNFALQTPAWQAPDEPAHYNYIADIVANRALPVLHREDYSQQCLETLINNRFPVELGVDCIRYESYQPPLYYLLGALVYSLSGGSLLALRLLGIVIGVGIILLCAYSLQLVFADKPMVVLGATAFVAFLPMHVAVTAAVNNDAFAELLLLALLAMLLHWTRRQFMAPPDADVTQTQRQLLWLGVLLGLGLLTKIYAYLFIPLTLLAIVATIWQRQRSWQSLWTGLSLYRWVLLPALLLGLPWWVRNLQLYGGGDFLGLAWHDEVVIGQPRTSEWIATYGLMPYSERAFRFTFQSFWGVFGWMGVFMDERIYTAMLIFTGVLFLGLLWTLIRLISGKPDTDIDDYQRAVLIFFGLIVVAVAAGYIWYNTKFVQHQGRYFFWGLLPISTFVALGWREVMRPLQGLITGFLAVVLAGALMVAGLVSGGPNKWTLLTIAPTALLLLLQPFLFIGTAGYPLRWLPQGVYAFWARPRPALLRRGLRFLAWIIPFCLLVLLDALIPMLYIVPQLR
ncbi:MAG: glycosyltransferase family 39 protein [Caldilineaceae bacterium]|nr:glycosyltransferase family 39 protein [Caldilineaceae bacterium]